MVQISWLFFKNDPKYLINYENDPPMKSCMKITLNLGVVISIGCTTLYNGSIISWFNKKNIFLGVIVIIDDTHNIFLVNYKGE